MDRATMSKRKTFAELLLEFLDADKRKDKSPR